MNSTDKIIEAVLYTDDSGEDWWEVFTSKNEALNVIRRAIKETPAEEDIVCLMSVVEYDTDMFSTQTASSAYKHILRKMEVELKETLD